MPSRPSAGCCVPLIAIWLVILQVNPRRPKTHFDIRACKAWLLSAEMAQRVFPITEHASSLVQKADFSELVQASFVHGGPLMAVDLGGEFLKVSVVKPGRTPISIVANEMSKRRTSAQLAFIDGDRLLGEEAAALAVRYPDRVYARCAGLSDSQIGGMHELDDTMSGVLSGRQAEQGMRELALHFPVCAAFCSPLLAQHVSLCLTCSHGVLHLRRASCALQDEGSDREAGAARRCQRSADAEPAALHDC